MNYYKKDGEFIASDLTLDLERATKSEYDEYVEKNNTRISLFKQLDQLDSKSIRAIRAKEAGTATQDDLDKLAELEEQAEIVREQIKQLGD